MPPAPSWSLAMIVRDEEAVLARVLDDAAGLCDEVVVVDTGSTDATATIAAEHGARVVDLPWSDDFAAARNRSFAECSGEWILWLDADDHVPPEAREGFLALKEELVARTDVAAAMVPYHVAFLDADPGVCTFRVERERVVRRAAGLRWTGRVHEILALPGGGLLRWPRAWVEHRPVADGRRREVDRNLRILEGAYAEGDRSSRTLFYLANERRDHRRWEQAAACYHEYLDSAREHGVFVWEQYAALRSLASCAKHLGQEQETVRYLLAAVAADSSRAEALADLGLFHYERSEWARAIPYFAAAAAATEPAEGFVEPMAYQALPWDYLSVCHAQLGRFEEALRETVVALRTSTDRARLLQNLELYLDRLGGG